MLEQLFQTAPDAEIAIIGSGPSAVRFDGSADISIAVNGAAMLGATFDFFMYGDRQAPHRSWSTIDCARCRIVAHHVAATDRFLYPDSDFPFLDRSANVQSADQELLPAPVPPHLHFQYRPFVVGQISRKNEFLMFGGTIACCAVQLAYAMGASRLKLFGCEFSHRDGDYFKTFSHVGSVSDRQYQTMEATLKAIRNDRVRVTAYGKSILTEVDHHVA